MAPAPPVGGGDPPGQVMAMDRLYCAACNVEHDLSQLEPNFTRPDALLALGPADVASRVRDFGDAVAIGDGDGTVRHYLHVRLPVPVRGERDHFHWVAWVQVGREPWHRLVEGRGGDAPFSFVATLANDFPGYPSTLGLPGSVHVVDRALRPSFVILPDVRHPLAAEQREGILPERLLEIVGAHG